MDVVIQLRAQFEEGFSQFRSDVQATWQPYIYSVFIRELKLSFYHWNLRASKFIGRSISRDVCLN